MSERFLLKGLFALIYSGGFAFCMCRRDEDERRRESGTQRYLPYIPGTLLPSAVAAIAVFALVFFDLETAARLTVSFCFGVFLHICLYYLLLMPALPFLRRRISARACAAMWMIPNYLYLTQLNYMELSRPLWVVEAPSALVWTLLAVWLAGFLGVLAWKIAAHLIFRARILRAAVPVTDPAALEVWRREVEDARFRKDGFRLVVSPAVRTPLSVGLFRRSVRVVLPERDYTPEELSLIFRHELIHIGREDAWSKFFLVFCAAMCWFNPLMWTAMEKSAEDLELSCDETVLLEAGDGVKRQYAGLLLRTAGDERGFTTCLSASASALRYRLRSVVETREKRSGALAVGLTIFLLCMSCGYVALAYGEGTGAELVCRSQDPAQCSFRSVWSGDSGAILACTDEAALRRWLSSLRMERVTGNYSFEPEGRSLFLLFDTPEGSMSVNLSDEFAKLVPLYGKRRAEYYYLPGGAGWEALEACFLECPALTVRMTGPEEPPPGVEFQAGLWRLRAVGRGETLYETDGWESPNGIYGCAARRAELSFSLPLIGDCVVETIPLEGGKRRAAALDGLSLSLPEEPSRYIVRGRFLGRDGGLYEAEFRFEVIGPVE